MYIKNDDTSTVWLWKLNGDTPANYKLVGSSNEYGIIKLIMTYHFDSEYPIFMGYFFLKINGLYSF